MVISATPITYPESDSFPMADNTKQFRWIVYLKEGLDWIFRNDPQVFVAGDLLWYPVEGNNKLRQAPDTMVVFGRPKGDRGSYRQWLEDNIAPQAVFEVISPGNTIAEMNRKFQFYERYGVDEYYLYDPDRLSLDGFIRQDGVLEALETIEGWVSPRLGIRFGLTETGDLNLIQPNGQAFESYQALAQRAETAEQRAKVAEQKAEALAQRLQDLGVDP
jgi:Uma2 family endonuclease